MTQQEAIRAVIRTGRKRKKLRQIDLAHMSGCSLASISGYESGRRTPETAALMAIIGALGIPRDVILDIFYLDGHSSGEYINQWLKEE